MKMAYGQIGYECTIGKSERGRGCRKMYAIISMTSLKKECKWNIVRKMAKYDYLEKDEWRTRN